jgi:Xaa-Pro dipeptidase
MVFKGKEEMSIDSTGILFDITCLDTEYEVEQESFFYYLFGVNETGCYALINIATEEAILFPNEPNPLHQIWTKIYTKEWMETRYGMKAMYSKDLNKYIESLNPVILN